MSVAMRKSIERKIVKAFVASCLNAGYSLSVSLERGYDIDEMLVGSTDKRKITREVFAGDECHVFVHAPGVEPIENGSIAGIGWVNFVFGNDGPDVINDYSVGLERAGLMSNALALADKYS